MKYTIAKIENLQHTYEANLKKKIKFSDTIYSLNVVGADGNPIQDQLVEFNSGEHLQVILSQSFKNCTKLKKVVLQSSTKRIENEAFKNCINLDDINIESGIFNYIGDEAFAGMGIKNSIMWLDDQIKRRLNINNYTRKSAYNPDDWDQIYDPKYDPKNEQGQRTTLRLDYIPERAGFNAFGIGHDCIIKTKDNKTLKWQQGQNNFA